MNGHQLVSTLSVLSNILAGSEMVRLSLSSEKAFKIGADLVRQIRCYFEFHFRVRRIYLDHAG